MCSPTDSNKTLQAYKRAVFPPAVMLRLPAQGEGLLAVAGARPPLNPDYRDLGRPLRRMLKQMGSGSLTAGTC
jgi:hypothetical protein